MNKRLHLAIAFFIVALPMLSRAQTFTWNGSISGDWNTSTNWTPNGIPGAGSTVQINSDAVPNTCTLDADRSIAILTVSAGSYDGNGFQLTTTTRTTITGGVLMNFDVSAVSINNVREAVFNGTTVFLKTGSGSNTFYGGNTFNGPVTFYSTNAGRMRIAGTDGDVFNDDVTFYNSTTTSMDVAYRDTTYFNGNVYLENNNTGGIRIGASNVATTVSYIAAGGALLNNGFTNGTLQIRRMTQAGTAANGSFTPTNFTASNSSFGGDFGVTTTSTTMSITDCAFTANCTLVCETNLTINGANQFSSVSGSTSITRQAAGTSASNWVGGNTFGPLTVVNNSNFHIRLANTNGDNFLGAVVLNNSGSGGIQLAYNGTNTFSGDLTLNNTGSGTFTIGGSSGTSTQSTGSILTSGYSGATLTINGFTQSSSTANGSFNPTIFNATNTTLNGNLSVTTSSGNITLNGSSFTATNSFVSAANVVLTNANTFSSVSGTTTLTANSPSGNMIWTGGNAFNNTTINFDGTFYLRMSNTVGDTFSGTTTFNHAGSGIIYVGYAGTNVFHGNCALNNTGTGGFNFGQNGGMTQQTTGRITTTGYANGILTVNNFTQDGSSANDALTPTTFTANNCSFNGGMDITTTSTTLTINNCTFSSGNNFDAFTNLVLNNANSFSTVSGTTTLTGRNSGAVNWAGGNTFGDVIVVSEGSSYIRLANTTADTYLGTARFIVNNSGGLQIAYAGANTFADDIILDNNSTGAVTFCGGGGTAVQSSGSILTNGFTGGSLTLSSFTQSDVQANQFLNPASFTATNCDFSGDFSLTTSAGTLAITTSAFRASNTFNAVSNFTVTGANSFSTTSGSTDFTVNGSTIITWTGGNTFGNVSFTHNSTALWRLANTNPDTYTGSATFVQASTGLFSPAYAGNNLFSGDISTVGTTTAITFGSSTTGRVTLNGSSMQTISGSASFPPTISRLTMSTGGSGGLTLAVPLRISNDLTLTSGNIFTDATNILTLTDESTTTTVGHDGSFIDGPMEYAMLNNSTARSTLNFPVGSGSDWRPAVLEVAHTVNTSYTYRTEVSNESAWDLGYDLPVTVKKLSDIHYWNVTRYLTSTMVEEPSANLRTAAGQEPQITLYFGENDIVYDGADLVVCKTTESAPGTWIDVGGSGAPAYDEGNLLSGSVTSTSSPSAFNSFSIFTLGSFSENPLPVTLTSFSAVPLQDQVMVAWRTETEWNSAAFAVERSLDGKTFETIGTVEAAGYSTAARYYSWMDVQPVPGLAYYRLKELDGSGLSTWHPVVAVQFGSGSAEVFTVYPNPFQQELLLRIRADQPYPEKIQIFDALGQLVHTFTPSGSGEIRLNLVELQSGVYYLIGEGPVAMKPVQLVKQ